MTTSKGLLSGETFHLSEKPTFRGCVLEAMVRKYSQYPDPKCLIGRNKEATVINHMEKATKIGEITCVRDAMTGDYSLSLHGAIAALAAENERLHITIDYLMDKIACLGCEPDLHTLGTA